MGLQFYHNHNSPKKVTESGAVLPSHTFLTRPTRHYGIRRASISGDCSLFSSRLLSTHTLEIAPLSRRAYPRPKSA